MPPRPACFSPLLQNPSGRKPKLNISAAGCKHGAWCATAPSREGLILRSCSAQVWEKQIKILQCVNICFAFGVIKWLVYAPVSRRCSLLLIFIFFFFFFWLICVLGVVGQISQQGISYLEERVFFLIFSSLLLRNVVKQMDRRDHKICRAINPTICHDWNAAQMRRRSSARRNL